MKIVLSSIILTFMIVLAAGCVSNNNDAPIIPTQTMGDKSAHPPNWTYGF